MEYRCQQPEPGSGKSFDPVDVILLPKSYATLIKHQQHIANFGAIERRMHNRREDG